MFWWASRSSLHGRVQSQRNRYSTSGKQDVRADDKEQGHPQEDKKFLKRVTQGIRHTEDGHYEIPLPLCRDDVPFPENKEKVLQIAHWLRKKLINNETYYKDYVNFMNSIITKVPSDRLFAKTGQVWYIPHHGV